MADDDWLHQVDPALRSAAVHSSMALVRAEQAFLPAVYAAMRDYLRLATRAVLGPAYRVPGVLVAAAGDDAPPDLDAWPPDEQWTAIVTAHITPVASKVFGAAFDAQVRGAVLSDTLARLSYLENVYDRLSPNLWPLGVFEEVRYELLEGLNNGESINQLRDRVGYVTHIDAYSRRVRAEINALRRVADDPMAGDDDRAAARSSLRSLYRELDEADTTWHYQARRVARTETIAAVNGGSYAGQVARAQATGEPAYKQWLATDDARTRDTHVAAHGQVRPLDTPFLVGGHPMQHPGEAGAPAAEVCNCRCTVLYLSEDEARRAGYDPAQLIGVPT